EKAYGNTNLETYRGKGFLLPVLFTCFSITGISLIGLPPTAGFVAKLLVFSDVFGGYQNSSDPALLWLLIVGALTSVISLFYYFKIPLYASLGMKRSPEKEKNRPVSSILYVIGIGLTIFLFVFGLFPTLASAFLS